MLGRGGNEFYRPLKKEEIENIKLLCKAEVRTIDEHLIAPLVEKLKEEGLYDQTMLIVTSDHGDEIFDHGGWQHMHSLYNELIRVPLIIKFPHSRFRGKRIENNVRSIDLVPTILEEIGLKPSNYDLDGKSLIPLIKGKEKEDRLCFSETGILELRVPIPKRTSLVWRNWKLIINENITNWEKFFEFPPRSVPTFELFDLKNDPLEKRNIYSDSNEIAQFLLEMIKEYKRKEVPKGEGVILDEEAKEKLRALGYID